MLPKKLTIKQKIVKKISETKNKILAHSHYLLDSSSPLWTQYIVSGYFDMNDKSSLQELFDHIIPLQNKGYTVQLMIEIKGEGLLHCDANLFLWDLAQSISREELRELWLNAEKKETALCCI